ncbi:MAG TPA: MlaD family protein [Ferruginibacter sp.]|nr:MCE family protein [Chitinophagaceae bacterium]HQW94096.1 MlaD family protein [Ferruginibacter sp.]
MKISNETKIGALTAIAIVLLILGFNFLKGKTFFGKSHNLFAKYTNVQGLAASNPVMINGLQVGTVYSITTDKNMKEILVNMNMTKDVNIPVNSIAIIKPSLLGITSVEITLGDAKQYIPKNDTIATEASSGIFTDVLSKVDPILYQVTKAVTSIDSVLMSVNHILDPNAKNNIGATLANLNKTTANLIGASASLQVLLNTQTGALAGTLNNLNSFTSNLDKNSGKINNMVSNLDKTATNLSNLDLQQTLNTLNTTIGDLKSTIGKLNSTSGTAGLLLNDTKLYNNLTATANKLNLLIDDLKTNPKRYINISVFGKKNTSTGLLVPLPDTVNAPYLNQK